MDNKNSDQESVSDESLDDSVVSESPKSKKIQINDFSDDSEAIDDSIDELVDDESETAEIDNDVIDIKEEDEVIGEDVLTDDEASSVEELDPSDSEDYVAPEIIDDKDSEKTIAEAIEESENAEDSDSDIDEAVDDIVRSESDGVLELEDQKVQEQIAITTKKSKFGKIRSFFGRWWDNLLLRYLTIVVLIASLIAATVIPFTRYSILNLFGVRVASSMTIIDSQTRLPLKNINVSLQDKSASSDENGKVEFTDLKQGSSDLTIFKRGYADTKKQIVLGWGSNPIGEQEIAATGVQYSFVLKDWITGEAIKSAEATAGENSALSDDNGKIILTIGETDLSNIQVTISASGYRDFVINTDELTQEQLEVTMVSDRRHVFVSNRNGNFDIYGIYLDGKDEQRVVEASGSERVVPTIMQNPTTSITAFVSSREGFKNKDGYLLDGLYILDASNGSYEKIGRSEQIQLVGWSGDRLIYWEIVEGVSANNPERSKLFSYEVITKEKVQLATSNYFNDIELVGNTVYYAVSGFAVPTSLAKLFAVDADGKNQYTVLDAQVYTIFRTKGANLLLNASDQKWYEVKIGQDPVEVPNVSSPSNLVFVNSPDGTKSAWIDIRDGKGVLLKANTEDYLESQVYSAAGISSVMYWVGENALVYRVIKTGETADYFIKTGDPVPVKITDVTVSSNNFY